MFKREVPIRGQFIHVEIEGEEHLPTVVFLHGFTGSTSTWIDVRSHLAGSYRTVAVDLTGHGKTSIPDEPDRYTMKEQLADLNELFRELNMQDFYLVGYSMGGRVALAYTVEYPEKVTALILESSSPGLESVADRHTRKAADQVLAQKLVDNGLESFVNSWENIPLFHSQKLLPAEQRIKIRQERLSQTERGLSNSLLGIGTGSQPSYWHMLDSIRKPVFLLTGELDEKFVNIAKEMKKRVPSWKHTVVSDAGHAIHVEKPSLFATMIKDYMKELHKNFRRNNMTRQWETIRTYEDIKYEKYNGIAKVTINRPEVRNAFRPKTVMELIDAFSRARDDSSIGVIILTGEGEKAFCSGGDQSVRGHGGYVGDDEIPRLNVLDLQRLIRVIPKPVVAMIAGFAIGGGHVLHVVCDLTIAADNARFGQTGPKVGSFDAGYGSGYLARIVGHKKAREIWFLCRQYDAQEALDMGLVNTVVPYDQLEDETVQWCEEMLGMSPTALRFVKAAMNADTDGLAGLQQMAGDATLLYYTTDEAKEGRDAFKEKRKPDFGQFPRFP